MAVQKGETFEPVLTSCGSNLVSIALPTPVPRPMMLWPPRSPQCAHRPCPPRPLMAWAS
jgi:hypothetical protein